MEFKKLDKVGFSEKFAHESSQGSALYDKGKSLDVIVQSFTKKLLSETNNESNKTRKADAATVLDLPENILLTILNHLGHGDLLTARLVNKTLNNAITNFQNFALTKMIYLIKCDSGAESKATLKKSTVLWKRLRLENFIGLEPQEFIPPFSISAIVTSLELLKWEVPWDIICETLLKFPALEKLKIVNCKLINKHRTPVEFQNKLMESLENLKIIHLEVGVISEMIYFINQLNCHNVSNLLDISVLEITNSETINVTPYYVAELFSTLLTLIQNSATSLKSLTIDLRNFNLNSNFFPKVVTKLIGLVDLHNLYLKCLMRTSDAHQMEEDIDIFKRFIKSQKNLMEIYMPDLKDARPRFCSWNRLLQAVNKNITRIHLPSTSYLPNDFLDKFSQLHHLKFESNLEPVMKKCEEKSYSLMQEVEIESHYCDIKLLVLRFPNLTKLILDLGKKMCGNKYAFSDLDLQTIIRKLKKLKYLFLGNCYKVSDFGVSGVRMDYCAEIIRTMRKLTSVSEMINALPISPPEDQFDGSPISSLSGLTHLSLIDGNFTDVGIFYGFRFKELRYFDMTSGRHGTMGCCTRVTDWGLRWFARWNPDLDWAYLTYSDVNQLKYNTTIKPHFRRIKEKNFNCVQPKYNKKKPKT